MIVELPVVVLGDNVDSCCWVGRGFIHSEEDQPYLLLVCFVVSEKPHLGFTWNKIKRKHRCWSYLNCRKSIIVELRKASR
jgi:hypothetical protein